MERKRYTTEELDKIISRVSVLDYFQYLEQQGKVKFDRKTGGDYYFLTQENKFSVNENSFYDFKTDKGGKIIKAVMDIEKKSWKEAIEFLRDFANLSLNETASEKLKTAKQTPNISSSATLQRVFTPNNDKLLAYFQERGISVEVLKENTKQVHYEAGGKNLFGIGLKNEAGGYEVRNPLMKSKLGQSDISVIKGAREDRVYVFEGMTDMLSFQQLLKDNGRNTKEFNLVVLNSITNADKFIERYQDFKGGLYLILDGDKAGNETTQKIIDNLKNIKVEDIRYKYHIAEGGNNDLNDYLKNKRENKKINSTFTSENRIKNERDTTTSTGISHSIELGQRNIEQDAHREHKESQSEQNDTRRSGHQMVSENVGNGLTEPIQQPVRQRRGGTPSMDTGENRPQYQDDERRGGERNTISRLRQPLHGVGFAENGGSENSRSERQREEETTAHQTEKQSQERNDENKIAHQGRTSVLGELIEKYKGQKLTNEEVAEVVSVASFVSNNKKIHLVDEVENHEENLKNIVSQYKSGGVAKDGRGVLDEYYTNEKLVNAVRNLIKDNFKGKTEISVLEPSVGVGNFLSATQDLGIKTNITAFEINETTAKISKILYPQAEINLRSFETEFMSENGLKKMAKTYTDKYDLVIGNPPYGMHRGEFKGLGEETDISRYEDYFVKRSLDTMKEGGTLAMVLPSGWLNRQKNLAGAELTDAYRLPNGIFKGTDVGTDIIILKKTAQKEAHNISDYFKNNQGHILGEEAQKTNRYGKLEDYVKGSLDSALTQLERLQEKKFAERVGNLFEDIPIDEPKIEKELKKEERKEKVAEENFLSTEKIKEAERKISQVLEVYSQIKFKSVIVQNDINKYNDYKYNLKHNPNDFTIEELEEISKKADKTLAFQRNINKSDYQIQTEPEIKKKVLKYHFIKDDEVVNTALQNNPNISEKQIEAFRDTDYNGLLGDVDKHKEFANYRDGVWVHDFYYTEGDIYEKLEQLEVDKSQISNKQYEKQKQLLEAVLPQKKELEDIIISPNHEFVHNFIIGKVEKEVNVVAGYSYGERNPTPIWDKEIQIVDETLAEKFKNYVKELPTTAFEGSSSWEVQGFVDNEIVTGSDKERNALIRERRKNAANNLFERFIREELSADLKERFVNEFNRSYNNVHIPDYSQFPLFSKIHQNFKGEKLNLTEVQKAGIGRLTTKGVGLLAHEVGFGKTLSGILSMHEAMERGNAKRPLIVVPNNNILKQWVETIFETIPNAKVNVLGNLGKDYDLSKFDNKDGEITLVTYEGFNNIGFRKEITENLASKFSYISEQETKSIKNSERDIQLEIQKGKELEGKMKRGKVYDWEDFGFDHMTFDEVHNANHIIGKVRIEDKRYASDFRNQNQATSQLGINTWMASQYLQEKYDGRNVTLLSATPFTNKPLEYYSILSLVANERLEKSGYFNVNTFFETFMEVDSDMKIDAKGDVKFKTNVRRFKNNTLFQQLLSEFIDIKGEEDNPELKRPNRINKEYKIEQNSLTEEQYDNLNNSYSEAQKGAVLTHILNARLIAISPYLSPYYEGEKPTNKEFIENSPKLKLTIDLISQNKKDNPNAGQIIYSELAVSEFSKIKDYLVNEVGYHEDEIGIITGAVNKNKRLDIQDKFNEGKIKVIIGSEAIQEGMNLQKKTSDMYLLSLPYNFTSLRQVEGRAWRQGNEFQNVRINFMLTNDSIDVFMLEKLQVKQARYMEAMKKGANVIDVSDINAQELKTSIITSPELRANIEVELVKKKLDAEKSKFEADKSFIERKFKDYLAVVEKLKVAKSVYVRTKEWSEDGSTQADWFKDQLPAKKMGIEQIEKEILEVGEKLEKKGINVSEFKEQVQELDNKIADIDNAKENLSILRVKLTNKYTEEKKNLLKANERINHIQERAEENKSFFKLREKEKNQNIQKREAPKIEEQKNAERKIESQERAEENKSFFKLVSSQEKNEPTEKKIFKR